ncbi:MAG: S1 family peptidase [Myxococcota bacterium]
MFPSSAQLFLSPSLSYPAPVSLRRTTVCALLACISSLATGCISPLERDPDARDPFEREPAANNAQAIAGGEHAPDETEVVGLLTGGSACSGTLIAPNLVLTAQHCVAATPDGPVSCGDTSFGPIRDNTMSVTTRDTVLGIVRHVVREVHVPSDATDVCGGDVAVMILDDLVEPEEAWPIPPRIDQSPVADEWYRAVGFGATNDNGSGSGLRRERRDLRVWCVGQECSKVYQVQPNEWMGETGICPGDSGGPAIDEQGRVIGITSRGGAQCSTPIYGDVAGWASWLMEMGERAAQLGGYEPAPWVRGGSTMPLPRPEPEPEPAPEPGPEAGSAEPWAAGAEGGCRTAHRPPSSSDSSAWLYGLALLTLAYRSRARRWAAGGKGLRHRGSPLALLTFAFVVPGCRCNAAPSEDELPATEPSPATSRAIESTSRCPARPAWAGELPDDIEVELLHDSKRDDSRHGTGYRLRSDGTFETYDDIQVARDDAGRMAFKRVKGDWTKRGEVRSDALAALRKKIAERSDHLNGRWRTPGARSTLTHLITLRHGKRSELCYVGLEAPQPVQRLQQQIHDLVNHVAKTD